MSPPPPSTLGNIDQRPLLDRTAQLLWQACRRHPEPDAIAGALDDGADVRWATRTAISQRVGPLLWRALLAAGRVTQIDTRAAAALEQVADLYRLEAQVLLPTVTALAVHPLAEAGLDPVIFKGPAVARRYPGEGLRSMDDIDLLLPSGQHPDAIAALVRAGWEIRRGARRDRYDTVLSHPHSASIALELHYGLEAWYERTNRLDLNDLWLRRRPIECFGVSTWGLAPEDEVLALAAHAGKPFHCFSRLVWISDLAMILTDPHGPSIDWEIVADRARQARCTTVVATALGLAGHAGVDVPSGRLPVPRRGWQASSLKAVLDPTWPLAPSDLSTFHLRFALVDGTGRRLVLLAGAVHDRPLSEKLRWPATSAARAARRLWRLQRGSTGHSDGHEST